MYSTWSARTCPTSWPKTVRSSSSSHSSTVCEVSTISGLPDPIAAALVIGNWVM